MQTCLNGYPSWVQSSGDDNTNNGAASCSNQRQSAFVGISEVISELEKLTGKTPDQTEGIITFSSSILHNIFYHIVSGICIFVLVKVKKGEADEYLLRRTIQEKRQREQIERGKRKGRTGTVSFHLSGAEGPAELGWSLTSDSSWGPALCLKVVPWLRTSSFITSSFQSEGTLNYCQP